MCCMWTPLQTPQYSIGSSRSWRNDMQQIGNSGKRAAKQKLRCQLVPLLFPVRISLAMTKVEISNLISHSPRWSHRWIFLSCFIVHNGSAFANVDCYICYPNMVDVYLNVDQILETWEDGLSSCHDPFNHLASCNDWHGDRKLTKMTHFLNDNGLVTDLAIDWLLYLLNCNGPRHNLNFREGLHEC